MGLASILRKRAAENEALAAAFAGALPLIAHGCSGSPPADPPPAIAPSPAVPARVPPATASATPASAPRGPAPQLDGRAFPDHVLALTWDDGPDADTFELAAYLQREKISATFFVVGAWVDGLSADPGAGRGVFATGHELYPLLGDLTAMGHRLGNHTLNHVLLWGADGARVASQLRDNQARIDPFLTSELRLFRAPGGAWDQRAAEIVAGDPYLRELVGPVRWDVDRKDWEGSVACGSARAAAECERAAPDGGLRLKARVTAQRYLASIEEARRGIVLLHDRVGHVGSRYALDVARALVPPLIARGYVFAAPVLEFSRPATRLRARTQDGSRDERARAIDAPAMRLADIDGDGRADACAASGDEVLCARAVRTEAPRDADGDAMPHAAFGAARLWGHTPGPTPGELAQDGDPRGIELADVDGDGRADACAARRGQITCARAERGAFGAARRWGDNPVDGGGAAGGAAEVRFGDIDGDGRADVCARDAGGAIACARSLGGAFDVPRVWLAAGDAGGGAFELADVTGDGRADACTREPPARAGLACAASRGDRFARFEAWGARELGGAFFGDLNGDGRADACAQTGDHVVCALSTGRAFTAPTVWLRGAGALRGARLADVSGDGRADVCAGADAGIVCALAP